MQSFFCVMKVGRDRPLSCRQYGELNRPDWLAEMNHTLAEAIKRVGPVWLTLIRQLRASWNTKTSAQRVRHDPPGQLFVKDRHFALSGTDPWPHEI
ncbi:MAG: hypothetical protein E5Y51_09830 [Mesorhizobium sp.]|nr:MAG: hypothetical protein E5Y51_09830 [Mesorhizobium sp.]